MFGCSDRRSGALIGAAASGGPKRPAPSPLPDEWKHATLFHADDFEHVPDGSFPPGWRYHPGQKGPLSDFSTIRRTLDGGGVLHLRGDGWVPLREKPTGGRLRIELDFRRIGNGSHGLYVHLIDTRPPVNAGWREAEEFGPWIDIDGASGEVASRRFDNHRSVHGRVDVNHWHRLTIVADLNRNHFSLAIDGQERGASISFYDPRWFRGGDRLVFQSRGALIGQHLGPPPSRPGPGRQPEGGLETAAPHRARQPFGVGSRAQRRPR